MSTNEQTPLSLPTSVVRNTLGREQAPQNLVRPVPDEDLREYCDKNYHQILPIIAEKLHQEKVQQEKLKAVKARLNFEEASQYSESETPNRRRNLKERLGPMGAQTRSISPKQRRGRSKSPKEKGPERRTVFKILEKGVFHRLRDKEKNVSAHLRGSKRKSYYSSRREAESCYQKSESEGSAGGHWKSKPKKQKSSMEDDLSQPWVCEETDPFTPRICYFDFPKTLMPSHIKTYDESEDSKDHLKIFQAVAKTERWAMPTWCHMFNSTLTGNARRSLEERWRPPMGNGRSRLHPGSKKLDRIKTSKEETSGMNKVEKKNASKFCEFHGEVGHTTDECMHLKRHIEEMLKAGKLSHLIKELKQNNGKDQAKTAKKGETSINDKPLAILMVQPWQRIARQRITQTFSPGSVIFFPALGEEDGTKGPMIIEAKMGRHCVHRIYVNEGSSSEILIGDEEHSTSAQMNFMVVRSPSPYNRIIGRPRVRKIRAILSTAHEMIKFTVAGGIVTLQSSMIITLECSMVLEPEVSRPFINQVKEEKIQVAIHLEYPEQTIAIGSTLTEEGRKESFRLLRRHLDVFAWKPADMKGVPRHIAEHRLNVHEGCLPAHTIVVIMDQPIKQLLSDPKVTGRLLKWRFKLGQHDIQYRPRTSVKGQILANFIMDFGAGLIIMNPDGMEFTYALRFRFNATNNEAEYEALIAGLWIASQMGIQNLQANVDLKLVSNQVNGIYIAKESSMVRYLEKVKNLAGTFKGFSIQQIPRGENKKEDALSKIASTSFAYLSKQVLVEELREKVIDKKEILAVVEEEGHTWMTPFYEYLTEGVLLEEKKKARTVRCKAGRYTLISKVLYKKSFLGLWLRCVGPLQANYVQREIYEGSCSMHAGPRSVVAKALMLGYFWPTMHTDAINLIRKCKDCQVHHPVPKNPQEKLTPITSPWPFYKWGIHIAGPFPERPSKELRLRSSCVITSYVDSDSQERSLGEGIKARLGEKNKNWVEEVSHVLWAHRTMIKSSNGETPFSLTYGKEAVIPAEIGMPTLRTAEVDVNKNNEALGFSLDLLEEKREQAAIQEAKSKARMEGYYNAKVQSTSFRPGDLVYQNNEASHAKDGGKLGPK
nr:reverse transcriptase domain-containing protein [Tanacetum cinerariifolium]